MREAGMLLLLSIGSTDEEFSACRRGSVSGHRTCRWQQSAKPDMRDGRNGRPTPERHRDALQVWCWTESQSAKSKRSVRVYP